MCFPGPSKNYLFRYQDRSQTPKSRRIDFFGSFLAPPLDFKGSQKSPKIGQVVPKGSKNHPEPALGDVLEPTLFQDRHPERSWASFLMILDGFLVNFSIAFDYFSS